MSNQATSDPETITSWLNDVKDEIMNDNTKFAKPTIAKVMFDNTYRPVKWGENDEDLPYKWFDDTGISLSDNEAYCSPNDIIIDDHAIS